MTAVRTGTPTPQGISDLLREAGYKWATVTAASGDSVIVEYDTGDGHSRETHLVMLAEYRDVITRAGYGWDMDTDALRLIITAEPETTSPESEER